MLHAQPMNTHALLSWYLEAGVDEAIQEQPRNYLAQETRSVPKEIQREPENFSPAAATSYAPAAPSFAPPAPPVVAAPPAAAAEARAIADRCTTLEELYEGIRGFDGLAIKKHASKTVIFDGNPHAKIMLIGEAPGQQEDIQGIPFCGPAGMLLDKMLASIGLDRARVYISNTLFWRPPGNRKPNPEELAICLPLVEKHIALVAPELLILSGGTATTQILDTQQGITRLRGKPYTYTNRYLSKPIPVAVTFHPSYLLRSPAHKRLAWQDLLAIQEKLPPLPAQVK